MNVLLENDSTLQMFQWRVLILFNSFLIFTKISQNRQETEAESKCRNTVLVPQGSPFIFHLTQVR